MELKLEGVTKNGDATVVNQVSYTFKHGVYGLLSVNGAGKTTLIVVYTDETVPGKNHL